MYRALFGSLVCLALVAGSAFAKDTVPSSGTAGARTSGKISKPKKGHATAAPLSAAAAYDATRTDLQTAPLHAKTPPAAAEKPWTGVYVGVNAGVAK